MTVRTEEVSVQAFETRTLCAPQAERKLSRSGIGRDPKVKEDLDTSYTQLQKLVMIPFHTLRVAAMRLPRDIG